MFCRARIRKRRRQNYFAKSVLKERKKPKSRTIDQGKWDLPPPKARRGVFIADKLKVVRRYKELIAEKEQAKHHAHAKLPRGLTCKQQKDFFQRQANAKVVLKGNILKKCKEEFPHITGKCQIWKWA